MPWCTTCDRFLSPSTVRADGTCPTCGRAVDSTVLTETAHATELRVGDAGAAAKEDLPPVPWHLKLLAGGIAVYLLYRLYQGIVWITNG